MARLLKSFFFKLFKDMTFRVTAIIGVALAILMTLLYFGIDKVANVHALCTGSYLFLSSISPMQNFGIAIPVNLIVFVTLLFSQGIIRNEVIAGNSKTKVYFSLFIGCGVFTIALLAIYVGMCVGLSSILGGFYPDGVSSDFMNGEMIGKLVAVVLVNYLLISTYSLFISSSLRNTGAGISLTLLPLILLVLVPMILSTIKKTAPNLISDAVMNTLKVLDPFYTVGMLSTAVLELSANIPNFEFMCSLISSLVYIAIFLGLGILVFNKKDIK